MDYGTPEFLREDMVDANPMVWLIQVDGLLVDARQLPPQRVCRSTQVRVSAETSMT